MSRRGRIGFASSASGRIASRDEDEAAYLVRALLGSRSGRLSIDGMAGGEGSSAVLGGVSSPFRPRLCVHVRVGVRVAMRHVRVGRIGRVLLAIGISRTGLGNGRIYRHLGVRIDGRLMVSPIRLGQRRTVLLRHTAGRGRRGRVV